MQKAGEPKQEKKVLEQEMIVNKTKIQGCAEGSGQEGERGKERKEKEENEEAIWQSGDQKEGRGERKLKQKGGSKAGKMGISRGEDSTR